MDTGRAVLVQSTFTHDKFRPGFDLVVPPVLGPPGGDVWQECAPMLPARRKYLLSFQGEMRRERRDDSTLVYGVDDSDFGNELDRFIFRYLNDLAGSATADKFYFEFVCNPANDEDVNTGRWLRFCACSKLVVEKMMFLAFH